MDDLWLPLMPMLGSRASPLPPLQVLMPLPGGGSIPTVRNADMGVEGANEPAERGLMEKEEQAAEIPPLVLARWGLWKC